MADQHIVQELMCGGLVITADISLAAELIEKGAFPLSPRGGFYSTENIRERLGMRDFMEGSRSAGVDIWGRLPCRRRTGRRLPGSSIGFWHGDALNHTQRLTPARPTISRTPP